MTLLRIVLVLFSSTLFAATENSTIIEVPDYSAVRELHEQLLNTKQDPSKLVFLLDLDDTLISMGPSFVWHKQWFLHELSAMGFPLEKAQALHTDLSKWQQKVYGWTLPTSKSFLKFLQESKSPVIALTKRKDDDPRLWQFLAEEKVAFSSAIFTNDRSKGQELLQQTLGFSPDHFVVFLDNDKENCQDVAHALTKLGVRHQVFHFAPSAQFDQVRARQELMQLMASRWGIKHLITVGPLPKPQVLLNTLSSQSCEKFSIPQCHWVNAIKEDIEACRKNPEDKKLKLIQNFTRDDAREILVPILKANSFTLSDHDLSICFQEDVVDEIETRSYDEAKLFSADTRQRLTEAAQKLLNLSQDGTLVFIGQTPAYLAAVVKQLAPSKPMITLPLSGRPDNLGLTFDTITDPKKKIWSLPSANAWSDVVTPRREATMRQVFISRGFDPQQVKGQKLYFVDNTRGRSFATLLRQLLLWFADSGLSTNELSWQLVLMGSSAEQTCESLRFCNFVDLRFDLDTRFYLPLSFLEIEPDLLDQILDKVPDHLRVEPPFSAHLWRPDYVERVFPLYPRPRAKALLEETRASFVNLLK